MRDRRSKIKIIVGPYSFNEAAQMVVICCILAMYKCNGH